MKFIRKHFLSILAIGLLLAIAIISHRAWFDLSGGVLFFHDWKYRPDEIIQQMLHGGGSSMWISMYGFGEPNIQPYALLPQYLWGLFRSYALAERIVFFIPIAILSVLSPYLLIKKINKNNWIAILSGLMYGFNTYLLMRSAAHLPIAITFALAPLVLLVFIRLIELPNINRGLQFVLLYTICCVYELRIAFIVSIVLFIYLIIFGNWKLLRDHIPLILFLLVVFLLLSAYWILPIPFITSDITKTAARGLWGDQYYNLTQALSFSDWKWTGGEILQNFDAKPIKINEWIVPIIAILGAVSLRFNNKIKDKKQILFFILIAVIGIFLSKQSDTPLPSAYGWLYNNVPGFSLFREASKYFLLIGIGYLGLFAYGLDFIFKLIRKYVKNATILTGIIFITVFCIIMINSIPYVSESMKGLSKTQQVPTDYEKLDAIIKSDQSFSRTLWIPMNHQMGYFDINHPKISLWSEMPNNLLVESLSTIPANLKNFSNPEAYISFLKSDYGKNIIDNWNVKYVIIPPELPYNVEKIFPYAGDRAEYIKQLDQIPYLKKQNIGSIDIYENSNYDSHVSTKANLYNISSYDNIGNQALFLRYLGIQSPNFFVREANVQGAAKLKSLFYNPKTVVTPNESLLVDDIPKNTNNSNIYKNLSLINLILDNSNNLVSLYTEQQTNPSLNDKEINFQQLKQNLASINYYPAIKTIFLLDDNIVPIIPNSYNNLGSVFNYKSGGFYNLGIDRITNGSFESGLWNNNEYCGNNHASPTPGISLSNDAFKGKKSLQLDASRQDITCANTSFNVNASTKNILSFDTKNISTRYAGYSIQFNDDNKTKLENKLTVEDNSDWQNNIKLIEVPDGATRATLSLYAYKDSGNNNIVLYDNVSFQQALLLKQFDIPKPSLGNLMGVNVDLNNNNNMITIPNKDSYSRQNLINNPSFEDKLWTPNVSDCHNYDNKPSIAQYLNSQEHSDGNKSIQLEAKTHYACTRTEMAIPASGEYSLSFDYKSITTAKAGYHIRFNDSANTVNEDRFEIADPGWQQYHTIVKAPPGATGAILTIYSYESNSKMNNILLYDNFKFIKIPELNNAYNLVIDPKKGYTLPKKLSFTTINSSEQQVNITGVNGQFLLSFAEKFNPGWNIFLNKIDVPYKCDKLTDFDNGTVEECKNNLSFASSKDLGYLKSKKPIFNDSHIAINGFANGWVIDSEYIKNNYSEDYYHVNTDGSINVNMIIYYKPQAFHYLGLLISGVGFIIICTVSITYYVVKKNTFKFKYKDKK